MLYQSSVIMKALVKAVIYLFLISFVYFYQITDVLHKYGKKFTNIAISEEILEEIKPPFMTLWFVSFTSRPSFCPRI